MATDATLVQGEVIETESPGDKNVELFLHGFLKALIAEQNGQADASAPAPAVAQAAASQPKAVEPESV